MGDGTWDTREDPLPISSLDPTGLGPARAVASGGALQGPGHTLAVDEDGAIWAWGRNNAGQLGLGPDTGSQKSPVKIELPDPEMESPELPKFVTVAAGENFSAALASDRTVWTWGHNAVGQLGLGDDSENHDRPTQILLDERGQAFVGITALAADQSHTIALKADGTVWVWGNNPYKQLGIGDNYKRLVPTQVGIEDVVSIAAGRQQTVALKSNGTVWAWGKGKHVGNGGSTGSWAWPVQVMQDADLVLSHVISIASGGSHSLALKSDDDGTVSVWGWGGDECGNIAPSGLTYRYFAVPLEKAGEAGLDVIVRGQSSFLHQQDGTLLRWGLNYAGTLKEGRETCTWGTTNATPEIVPFFGTARNMDSDDDGLTDFVELQLGLDYEDSDTDGDGIPDGWEVEFGLDGADPDNASGDTDEDGLTDLEEYQAGSDPSDLDTNDDGLHNGVSILAGLDHTSDDTDGDGLTNQAERAPPGTSVLNADTDGDGISDGPLDPDGDGPIVAGPDVFPLDPNRRVTSFFCAPDDTTPPCDPQDETPPVITVHTPQPTCVDDEGTGKCASHCGDRVVDRSRGESCDDGNTRSRDGCSASCQTEKTDKDRRTEKIDKDRLAEEKSRARRGNR